MSSRPAPKNPGIRKQPTPELKAAVIADYVAGMSTLTVAKKYGIGSASAHRIVKAAGVNRSTGNAALRAKERREAEFSLPTGHWTPTPGGVQIFQPCFFDSIQTCNINHQENSNAA